LASDLFVSDPFERFSGNGMNSELHVGSGVNEWPRNNFKGRGYEFK